MVKSEAAHLHFFFGPREDNKVSGVSGSWTASARCDSDQDLGDLQAVALVLVLAFWKCKDLCGPLPGGHQSSVTVFPLCNPRPEDCHGESQLLFQGFSKNSPQKQ